MLHRVVWLVVVVLLGAGLPALAAFAISTETGRDIVVVPYDYADLLSALEAVEPGGIVYVTPGEYVLEDTIVVDKPVTIIGASPEDTVIVVPSGVRIGFLVKTGNVTVARLTVKTMHSASVAMVVVGASNVSIVDARFEHYSVALQLNNAEGVLVENTSFIHTHGYGQYAVIVESSRNVVFNAIEALVYKPFVIRGSYNITVSNTVLETGYTDAIIVEKSYAVTIASSLLYTGSGERTAVVVRDSYSTRLADVVVKGYAIGVSAENTQNLTITSSIIVAWGMLSARYSNISFSLTTFYGHTVFANLESSYVRGLLNDFYADEPGVCRDSNGVLDNDYYNGRSYYKFLATMGVSDEYSGPAQDQPGPDGVSDDPIVVCRGVYSIYPSLEPQVCPENCSRVLGRWTGHVDQLLGLIVDVPGSDARASWLLIPVDLRGYFNVTVTVESVYSRAGMAIVVQDHSPFAEPSGGLKCNGYCIDGVVFAVELDNNVDLVDGVKNPHIAVTTSPSHGAEGAYALIELGEEQVVGSHLLTVEWIGRNNTLRVWYDGKQVASTVIEEAGAEGLAWLGLTLAVGQGEFNALITGVDVKASRPYEPPRHYVVSGVRVAYEPMNLSILVPSVVVEHTTVTRTITVTNTVTETVTATAVVTVTGRVVTERVVETTTTTLVETLTTTTKVYTTTTVTEVEATVSGENIFLVIMLTLVALVVARVIARR